jgi:Protein of unknown function (DUF1501)
MQPNLDLASRVRCNLSRRHFLWSGLGFGAMALEGMLRAEELARLPRTGLPELPPRAKNVIWLFMRGGFSHLETFDPKPAIDRYAGLSIAATPYKGVQDPEKLRKVRVVVVNDANGQQRNTILPLQTRFRPRGQSGIPVSDFFPHVGGCVDDLAIIRSMWTTDDNHGAQVQFHSGRHMLDGNFPTIGAWTSWGLGTLNENLPKFITMGPRFFDTRDGHYLGPAYDAVPIEVDRKEPLMFARPEIDTPPELQREMFGLVGRLDRISAARHPDDAALAARIKAYELAYRMQTAVPRILDFAGETRETQSLYGFDDPVTRPFGRQLLAARRLVEQGVRFVQIMHGDGAAGEWDAHSALLQNHTGMARRVDRPVAGLLADLKRRGLLDETIVVFATEFGRTPGTQSRDGRDHHPYGFSIWMAGGGLKRGIVHGATDELGFHAVEHPHYVTDVHATLLTLLGLVPRKLEVPGHKRLDLEFGQPIREIMA